MIHSCSQFLLRVLLHGDVRRFNERKKKWFLQKSRRLRCDNCASTLASRLSSGDGTKIFLFSLRPLSSALS